MPDGDVTTRDGLIAALRALVPEWMETADAEQVLAIRQDKILELVYWAEAGCFHQFGVCHGKWFAEKWDDPLAHRA